MGVFFIFPICKQAYRSFHLENRAIEALPVVSSLRFHAGDKTHKAGFYVNLRYCAAFSLGDCGAKQVGPIRMSSERPTPVDCLRELGRLIQRDHGPTCVTAAQKLQAAEKDAADASTNVLWMRELRRATQMMC